MDNKRSFDFLVNDPSFTNKNSEAKNPNTKLISINPVELIIEKSRGQIDKTLEIKNVYPCRIAYRIKCNGPTRYVVQPKMGFVAVGDKTTIHVTLIDGNKYQSNHAFIVQAMPAPGDSADRKLVWNQPNLYGILTNTRIRTMRPTTSLPDTLTTQPPTLGGSPKTAKGCSTSSTDLTVKSSGSNPSLTPICKPEDHGEFALKVEELSEQLHKAVDQKQELANQMIVIVNEIKSIEVDLDRHTQLVNELSERIRNGEIQYSNLLLTENALKEQIESKKTNPKAPGSR